MKVPETPEEQTMLSAEIWEAALKNEIKRLKGIILEERGLGTSRIANRLTEVEQRLKIHLADVIEENSQLKQKVKELHNEKCEAIMESENLKRLASYQCAAEWRNLYNEAQKKLDRLREIYREFFGMLK